MGTIYALVVNLFLVLGSFGTANTPANVTQDLNSLSVGNLYIALSAIPSIEERKSLYAKLNGKNQAKLWQLQALMGSMDDSFSIEQRAYFRKLADFLDGKDFGRSYVDTNSFEIEAANLGLSKSLIFRYVAAIGGNVVYTNSGVATKITYLAWCECSQGDDWCGRKACKPGECRTSGAGCGWWLLKQCDGNCN